MRRKKEILVVDDNEINREMLAEILKEKYSVLQAENGRMALELLKGKEGIALILLDVMMPVMDGYTFLDRIKEDKELSLIPVIVLTEGNSEEAEVAALAHGATDFVPKPYRPQVILHRIESIINLRETAAMVNQLRYDRLTGIYTKEYFYQKALEKLQENPDKNYCIVCSNIENFKLFNDVYGVNTGDELLKETAAIMRKMMGTSGVCGRFSADRFICLQEFEQEEEDRANFGKLNMSVSSNMKKVVMRWGIYHISDRTVPLEQMCDRAMLAVNSIKGTYNQFFAVYDDVLRDKLLREKAITDAMEGALSRGEFVVYFQPKYSLTDNCLVGAEALVRWVHPVHGVISPGVFIPLFEKNGFISRLDKYVWEQVCLRLNGWKEKGYPLLPISVNVSRADIYRPNLETFFTGLIEKYGVDPSYLHLEITESAYAENQEQIITTVDCLRNLGFDIEMDDFGSGYSSLSMLSRMKLDELKLDMKFVHNETAKPLEHSILNDVINMAHRLNLKVVAEGVETREQMRRLQTVGCDFVQGFFLAKPMPVEDFEKLLLVQRKSTAAPGRDTHSAVPEKYSVIIADEDLNFSGEAGLAFKDEYNVIQTADADKVIDAVNTNGEAIGAIVLSMTLPDGGAAKIMKCLRSESGYWQIPVLATIPSSSRMQSLPLALEADDFLCKLHPVFDLRKKVQRLVDEAVTHRRVNALLNEAHHDFMTGLLNRRGLNAAMEQLRKEHVPVALCMFDLDNLKRVNDTYGHDVGDRMISSFCDLLKRSTRSDDYVCRYGGDEFVVILRKIGEQDALKRAKEICERSRKIVINESVTLSCSGGVVTCGVDEPPSLELIERADEALYSAKRNNKGSCNMWQKG
ncbi:MAG: EAL domain-containing protein [Candidatus Coproplasma sp.]